MKKLNERTILVTGATGMLGSEVVKQLHTSSSSGYNTIRDQLFIRKIRLINLGIIIILIKKLKLLTSTTINQKLCKEALKMSDRVFLLTPFRSDMVQLSSNLITEAKKAGIRHIGKTNLNRS